MPNEAHHTWPPVKSYTVARLVRTGRHYAVISADGATEMDREQAIAYYDRMVAAGYLITWPHCYVREPFGPYPTFWRARVETTPLVRQTVEPTDAQPFGDLA